MGSFYHRHPFSNKQPDFASGISETSGENLMVPFTWQENNHNGHQLLVHDDDASLRSCVFPCQGNERPSQGLSLSLSSSNPSAIGLQSFELISHATNNGNPNNQEEMRFMDSCSIRDDDFFGKPTSVPQPHQQILLHGRQFDLRSCKYLGPAQELLNEFCGFETKQNDVPKRTQKQKLQWEDEDGSTSSSSSRKQSLYSLEFVDLQKRKTKLLAMLEEVERRYRHYCDQMKAVVSSFESVTGAGAAAAYSSLASKAMSKHFRCLKDGILAQIHATKKAIGEKEDPVAPGISKGETPRLRVIDQVLRQRRAFQQMSMMESHPWRPQRGLPERSVSVLRAWLFEHFLHPYPSDVDKHILARQTGLSRSQVSNWFINARVRLWKPMVEEMYVEESKDGAIEQDDEDDSYGRPNIQTLNLPSVDQKPTSDQLQLTRIDSDCLSSIISNPDKNDTISNRGGLNKDSFHGHHEYPSGFGAFGAVELDFSSYTHPAVAATSGVSFPHHNVVDNGRSGGSGVSLTLGLQQHGGRRGVSMAFPPASQSSMLFTRDHVEDCQPGQYSMLDSGEGQNSPYGSLMGTQLLHDLAG